jgi:Family of unknown function (DUF5677)
LETQSAFFAANNPFQPVVGGRSIDTATGESRSLAARQAVRAFWKQQGSTRRDGPSLKEMATDLGLQSTYDYVYFAASNFSHFNPQALLRTGWGDNKNPFQFSLRHISGYYKALTGFYGAVLFLGFHSAFSPEHFETTCDNEAAELIDLHRWPELITFEEMNQRPPLYFLTHAVREVAKKEHPIPYGGILHEVRGLRNRIRRA